MLTIRPGPEEFAAGSDGAAAPSGSRGSGMAQDGGERRIVTAAVVAPVIVVAAAAVVAIGRAISTVRPGGDREVAVRTIPREIAAAIQCFQYPVGDSGLRHVLGSSALWYACLETN